MISGEIEVNWFVQIHSILGSKIWRRSLKTTDQNSLRKKWCFPLRVSSVNVTKSAVSCGFGHIYWKKSLMENFIFCTVISSEKITLPSILWLFWILRSVSICENMASKFKWQFLRKKMSWPNVISILFVPWLHWKNLPRWNEK